MKRIAMAVSPQTLDEISLPFWDTNRRLSFRRRIIGWMGWTRIVSERRKIVSHGNAADVLVASAKTAAECNGKDWR